MQSQNVRPEKVDFDFEALNEEGLIGPKNGLVRVDYEFCFPKEIEAAVLLKIDPSLRIKESAKGRSNCTANESLAIGHTHQKDSKQILLKLSSLDYIKTIRRVWYE